MTTWKFTDATRRIVARSIGESTESRLVEALDEDERGKVLDADPVVRSKDDVDLDAARADAEVLALAAMTPAEAAAWVDANVTTIATARTALRRMVKVLCILARRL